MASLNVLCHHCQDIKFIEVSDAGFIAWQSGMLIQDALPELSDAERELLISATCDDCWTEMFGEFEE